MKNITLVLTIAVVTALAAKASIKEDAKSTVDSYTMIWGDDTGNHLEAFKRLSKEKAV